MVSLGDEETWRLTNCLNRQIRLMAAVMGEKMGHNLYFISQATDAIMPICLLRERERERELLGVGCRFPWVYHPLYSWQTNIEADGWDARN